MGSTTLAYRVVDEAMARPGQQPPDSTRLVEGAGFSWSQLVSADNARYSR